MLEANAERSTSNAELGSSASVLACESPNCTSREARATSPLPAIVRNDVVPFVSRRAGDECDHRLGIAHVEDFMRHAGLDVDEIAGLVFDHLFQAWLRIRDALFLR